MRVLNIRTAAVALLAGIGLAGCAYGPYGGVGVGYGSPYGYDGYSPYGYGSYSPYGYSPYGYYGGGMPYYGWYDGFYYPGTGYYVYDRDRNQYRMTDAQRKYWDWRAKGSPTSTKGTARIIQNWADFANGPTATTTTVRQESVSTSPIRVRDTGTRYRTRDTSETTTIRSQSRGRSHGIRVRNSGVDND